MHTDASHGCTAKGKKLQSQSTERYRKKITIGIKEKNNAQRELKSPGTGGSRTVGNCPWRFFKTWLDRSLGDMIQFEINPDPSRRLDQMASKISL